MNFSAVFAIVFCLVVAVHASGYGGGAAAGGGGYGAVSIPAPPCPKNFLLGCEPRLITVPCGSSCPGSYGGAGAYSNHYHIYSLPQYFNGYKPTPEQY